MSVVLSVFWGAALCRLGRGSLATLAPFQQSSVLWGFQQVPHFGLGGRFWVELSILSFRFFPFVSLKLSALGFIMSIFAAVKADTHFGSLFVVGVVVVSMWFSGTKVTSSGAPRPLSLISLSRWRTMSL